MGKIDWANDAAVIERYVRGLNPWPSAYTTLDGKQLKIWRAKAIKEVYENPGSVIDVKKNSFTVACGKGALEIFELQLEGKKRMETGAFLLGYKILAGDRFE